MGGAWHVAAHMVPATGREESREMILIIALCVLAFALGMFLGSMWMSSVAWKLEDDDWNFAVTSGVCVRDGKIYKITEFKREDVSPVKMRRPPQSLEEMA